MPGGCYFGVRPIDQHLKGFTALGATVAPMEHGMIDVVAERLVGNSIYLDMVSVGADGQHHAGRREGPGNYGH